MIYMVCGNPVLHSKSPVIFNTYFEKNRINSKYLKFAPQHVSDIPWLMKELGISGANITAPYKKDIISYLDSCDEEAASLDSVNTVVNRDGKLYGHSTDSYGVSSSLQKYIDDLSEKRALLLGAGGAGSAAAYALASLKIPFTVANRTVEKAEVIASRYGAQAVSLDDVSRYSKDADIIINTLLPSVSVLETPHIKVGAFALDAIYKPSVFQITVREAGCTLIKGEEWLFFQADKASDYFFHGSLNGSVSPDDLLKSHSKKTDTIALVGFMGSGKTTVGRILAKQLGYDFLEMDQMIEEREKMNIPDIFDKKGESYFREKEASLLKELFASEGKKVISCGGGVIENEESRRVLSDHLTVWIYTDIGLSYSRVKNSSRPLVRKGKKAYFDLFKRRKELYAHSSELIVANRKKMKETANRLYDEIRSII